MRKFVPILALLFHCLIFPQANDNCFTIIAGKETTNDGSVMIAHNEDDRGNYLFVNIHKVSPTQTQNRYIKLKNNALVQQVKKLLGYLWLQIPGQEFADSYLNEKGVVIVSNSCPSKETNGDLTRGGIGFMLRKLVAERAKTAREAVNIAGELINKYGYYSSGRTLCIADSQEGWILHVVQGKHWIAQRVPDNHIAVIANRYTINKINFSDSQNFIGSKDLIEYAIRRGWFNLKKEGILDLPRIQDIPMNINEIQEIVEHWKPKDTPFKIDFSKPTTDPKNLRVIKNIIKEWRLKALEEKFDFAKIYSKSKVFNARYNILRQWRGTNLLSKKKYNIDERLPFSFVPDKKIRVTDLFAVLRDHYENSKYDLTNNYKTGSPNSTKNRTICTETTRYAVVAQLRNNLPEQLKYLAWIAFRRPDTNAFTPWYFSLNSIPNGYRIGNHKQALTTHFKKNNPLYRPDMKFAYWNFDKLSSLVDLDYRNRIRMVRKEWINFENYILKKMKKTEKEFKYILGNNKNIALNFITNYTHNLEFRKWFLTTELMRRLKE